jgi:hypothetical protein
VADPATEKRLWDELKAEREKVRRLERELAPFRRAREEQEQIARAVLDAKPLPWLLKRRESTHGPGVPVLNLSDLHLNETVLPEEVAGVNEFDPEIAQVRLERVFQGALDLAYNHMVLPRGWKYPGMVVLLGGDVVDNLAGNFHTSDRHNLALRPAIAQATQGLAQGLRSLADHMGRLLVVKVPGNHGRTTSKMPMSGPGDTNLDSVIYDNLRAHKLLGSKEITWVASPGDEARFLVYDHAFVLTHGYQFRGGDGEIGALGPITRGVKRMRSKYRQLGMPVDTVVVEHFHQLFFGTDFIVNGSLKGYDAMAMRYNFPFQPPVQGMWFVHPERGITAMWAVHADEKRKRKPAAWASVEAA